jgi:hypothetical protein
MRDIQRTAYCVEYSPCGIAIAGGTALRFMGGGIAGLRCVGVRQYDAFQSVAGVSIIHLPRVRARYRILSS